MQRETKVACIGERNVTCIQNKSIAYSASANDARMEKAVMQPNTIF